MEELSDDLALVISRWDSFVIWCLERGLYRPRLRR
jgi:hypothetical protein